jgi:pyrroloquinoline-quinone synthase
MDTQVFFDQLEACIRRYDLLTHPFYQAWSRGELSREDLCRYARDYYHHVDSFPRYLAEFARRLPSTELRQAVLTNLAEEIGGNGRPSHSELWMDFAKGVGARSPFLGDTPSAAIRTLITFFHRVAKTGTPAQALAAFYVYESQVPRVAQEKLRGLREYYGANESACRYFLVHTTEDVRHARVWKEQLEVVVGSSPTGAEAALKTAEATAALLWAALPGPACQSPECFVPNNLLAMM